MKGLGKKRWHSHPHSMGPHDRRILRDVIDAIEGGEAVMHTVVAMLIAHYPRLRETIRASLDSIATGRRDAHWAPTPFGRRMRRRSAAFVARRLVENIDSMAPAKEEAN